MTHTKYEHLVSSNQTLQRSLPSIKMRLWCGLRFVEPPSTADSASRRWVDGRKMVVSTPASTYARSSKRTALSERQTRSSSMQQFSDVPPLLASALDFRTLDGEPGVVLHEPRRRAPRSRNPLDSDSGASDYERLGHSPTSTPQATPTHPKSTSAFITSLTSTSSAKHSPRTLQNPISKRFPWTEMVGLSVISSSWLFLLW